MMLTERIWEQWDNNLLNTLYCFIVCADSVWFHISLYCSLCVPVGGFSRQLTSMWRKAALHGWWPMRIFLSSLYQVGDIFIILEYSYKYWSNIHKFMSKYTSFTFHWIDCCSFLDEWFTTSGTCIQWCGISLPQSLDTNTGGPAFALGYVLLKIYCIPF